MSVRYEGAGARNTSTTIHGPGEEIGEDIVPEGEIALAFNYDEVFYLQGSREDVIRLMEDTLNELKAAKEKE